MWRASSVIGALRSAKEKNSPKPRRLDPHYKRRHPEVTRVYYIRHTYVSWEWTGHGLLPSFWVRLGGRLNHRHQQGGSAPRHPGAAGSGIASMQLGLECPVAVVRSAQHPAAGWVRGGRYARGAVQSAGNSEPPEGTLFSGLMPAFGILPRMQVTPDVIPGPWRLGTRPAEQRAPRD